MKLIFRIISRLSVALLGLMAVWAVAFYFIMVEEINDETDDSLEDYAYHLITRTLAGEDMPSVNNGTNNTYHLAEVSPEYAAVNPALRYADETVYMRSLGESEPARVLKTIFRDSEDHIFELTVAIPTFEKEDLQERILWWILILYAVLLGAVIAVNAVIQQRLPERGGHFNDFTLFAGFDGQHIRIDSVIGEHFGHLSGITSLVNIPIRQNDRQRNRRETRQERANMSQITGTDFNVIAFAAKRNGKDLRG